MEGFQTFLKLLLFCTSEAPKLDGLEASASTLGRGREAWGKTPKSAPSWRCRWHSSKDSDFQQCLQRYSKARPPNHSEIKAFSLSPDQGLLCCVPPCHSCQATEHPPRTLSPGWLLQGITTTGLTFILEITSNKTQSTHNWNSICLRSPPGLLQEETIYLHPDSLILTLHNYPPLTLRLQSWWVLRSPILWHSADSQALWVGKAKEMNLLCRWQCVRDDSSFSDLRSFYLVFVFRISSSH